MCIRDRLSTAPVLEDGRLTPRPVMLRGFTVADGEGYRVMPGGLARVSSGLDTLQTALQQGGISKDWWVLAPTPQKHVSLLRQSYGPIFVTRDGGDLPSPVSYTHLDVYKRQEHCWRHQLCER